MTWDGPGDAIWLDFPATPADCALGPLWAGRLGRDQLTVLRGQLV